MSENLYLHDARVTNDVWNTPTPNVFQQLLLMRELEHKQSKQPAYQAPLNETNSTLFKSVRPNVVQSIRAFKGIELAAEANKLDQHFLYANCGAAETKAEVLATISSSFLIPKPFGKSYDALRTTLTELVDKAGPQSGFVVMLERLPATQKFDKEARETLLEVFRDAADFWAARKINFRVFYSFALKSCATHVFTKATKGRRASVR